MGVAEPALAAVPAASEANMTSMVRMHDLCPVVWLGEHLQVLALIINPDCHGSPPSLRKQLVPLSEIEHSRAYVTAVTAKLRFARYLIHEGAYIRVGWSGDALAYAQFFNGLPVLQKRRETRALHARRRALDVQSLRSN